MKKIVFLLILLCIPFSVYAEELIPNAVSGILIEPYSGKIIFEKEKDKKVSVASLTKMVAQIIVLEEVENGNIKWNDVVTVSKNAADMGGSQIYLSDGEKMTVEDLMKGISVASGNDATVAMAEYISGSEEKFVKKMNKKVKELGLKHTNFVNCTGLDEKGHFSSAYDMAMIARELIINHSEILRFSSIYEDYLREDTSNKFWLVNTNKLISQYEGTDGLKTGHTDDAGYCLSATVKRGDLRLIGITLGEKDSKVRNKETIDLLDYGFNNTKLKTLKKKNSVIRSINLDKSDKKSINLILKDNLNVIEDIDSKNKYNYEVNVNEIKLPIKKGDVLGTIFVYLKNKKVSSMDLISDRDVGKLSLIDLFRNNIVGIITGNI
ncbi:MAG: D-alanyl-D-alanine carboxypeptidase [Bacilli bacterium]|nr:D-alanyl-D-alanine carboxypeptidase [Bacilli bacterium]